MFGADVLTFREFMMGEPLPLATLHNAVLEFLRGRDDVVLFGAQAVNAYVNEPRMTQDLDLLSTHAEGVAQALRDYLRQRFRIAVRIRRVGDGRDSAWWFLRANLELSHQGQRDERQQDRSLHDVLLHSRRNRISDTALL